MKTYTNYTPLGKLIVVSSLSLSSSLSAVTWTLRSDPGSNTYKPGTSVTAQLPDTATEDHNANRFFGPTSSVRVVNAEGISEGNGYTERYSGTGFFYDESGSSGGKMSIVSKSSYDVSAEKVEMDMFVSFGHVPRLITSGNDSQILQMGLLDISGGTSGKYFGDSSADALYLAFVADSNVKLDWNDTVASDGGDTGSITGDFTIRDEAGSILATLSSNTTLDATTYLGGGVNDNVFSSELYWYNMNLTFEEDGLGGLDITFDVDKYSNLSDIGWRTQQPSGAEDRLTTLDMNFLNTSTKLIAGDHGLGSLATLAPGLGANVADTIYLGTSGVNFDYADGPVPVPEPASALLLLLSGVGVCFRRKRV